MSSSQPPKGFYPSVEEYFESQRIGRSSQGWRAGGVVVLENQVLMSGKPPGTHLYMPMAHPELPFRLAHVMDDKTAREFVIKYGTLGYSRVAPHEEKVGGDPLWFFLGHARQVRTLLALARGLQDRPGDLRKTLLQYMTWERPERDNEDAPTFRFLDRREWQTIHYVGEGGDSLEMCLGDRDQVEGTATDILKTVISPNVQSITPKLDSTEQSGLRVMFGWQILLDVVYWHLLNIVSNSKPLAQCLECGAYFQQARPHQRFCPTSQEQIAEVMSGIGTRAQSRCALKYRARQHRNRRKEAQNG